MHCQWQGLNTTVSSAMLLGGHYTGDNWLGTCGCLQQLDGEDLSLTIGSETIQPSTVVRDLGVLIDSELTLQKHVSRLASSCSY